MDLRQLVAVLSDASPGGPLDRLAGLALDVWLDHPVGTLLSADRATRLTRHALEGWLDAPQAMPALTRVVESITHRLAGQRRTLRDVLPHDLRLALREVVGRPFTPDRRLVLGIIDQEPTRELIRRLLLDTILDFGRQVSTPMTGVASTLGAFARAATDTMRTYSGGLGSLVGVVSDEVERQLEKRAVDFVDAALAGVFAQIADAVSDPHRATQAAELRLAILDGVLALTLEHLARELGRADVSGGAAVLRAGLTRWLASAESDAQLSALATFALEGVARRRLRTVLRDGGLLGTVTSLGRAWLRDRMLDVVGSPAFAAWLVRLEPRD